MSKEVKDQTVAPAPVEATNKVVSMEEELKALELESARLAVLEKKANLEDLNERLAERQLKRDTIKQTSLTNGATLRALAESDVKVQKRCNHRKGGNGASGVVSGQGDSLDYALMKHTMLNGDEWIRCLRCGKTWKPPVKDHFGTIEEYIKALTEYEQAKLLPTKNTGSGACQVRFSDNGAYFREVMRHSTLR